MPVGSIDPVVPDRQAEMSPAVDRKSGVAGTLEPDQLVGREPEELKELMGWNQQASADPQRGDLTAMYGLVGLSAADTE
jgi:hypothetical protein